MNRLSPSALWRKATGGYRHILKQCRNALLPLSRQSLKSRLRPLRAPTDQRGRRNLAGWLGLVGLGTAQPEQWHQFLEAIPVGILVHDSQGQLVYANLAAQQLFGFDTLPAGTLAELSQTFMVYQEGTQDFYPATAWPIVRSLHGMMDWADDLELRRGQRVVRLETTSAPIVRQGVVDYAISTFQDITVRKTTEQLLASYSQTLEAQMIERTEALRQSEATQSIILNAIPDLLLRFSGDGICLSLMNAGDVPLVVTPQEQIGKPLFDFLPADVAEERLHSIRRALATGEMQTHEYRFTYQGQVRYEESRIVPSSANEVVVIVRDVTERKQAEDALKESQALYQSLTDVLPHCLYRTDLAGRLIFANPAFLKTLGKPIEACLGKTVYDFYPPLLADKYTNDNRQVIETGTTLHTVEAHQTPATEDHIYVQVVKSPVYGADGRITGVQGVFWDITDLKRTQDDLNSQRLFLQQVIDNVPSAIFVKDRDGRLVAVNQASAAMHGRQPEDMLGKMEPDFNPNMTAADMERLLQVNQQVMTQRTAVQEEQQITSISGEARWYQMVISPFVSPNGEVQGIVGNCIDITERKEIEAALQKANEDLARLATLDSLTKVANRRRFDEYLQQEWQRMVREGQPLSLILLDVDYFKIYNDHLGHQQGDDCLVQVAEAVCRAVKRSADLVARYGGEEFAIILPNTRRAGAVVVAEAIQAELANLKILHPGSAVSPYVTVSMGIASSMPGNNGTCEELVAVTDLALYQAKRRGRDRYWVRIL